MSNMPPDIVHAILGNLREDSRTLKQCTLVDQVWHHEAQSLLFGSHFVRIDFIDEAQDHPQTTHTDQRSPHKFTQTMTESPHLRSLIRIIILNLEDSGQAIQSHHRWSRTTDPFSLLLNTGLEKLEKLVLCGPYYTKLEKAILPQLELIASKCETIYSSVTCLEFYGEIDAPDLRSLQCFLCSFPQLQHLYLGCLPSVRHPSPGLNPKPAPTTLQLQQLTIDIEDEEDNSGIFMEWLSQTKTVGTLEHLTFTDEWDTPHLAEFVAALSKPWSLHIMDGGWLRFPSCRISSNTLVELMIDDTFKFEKEIRKSMLVENCGCLDTPVLITLHWRIHAVGEPHHYIYFTDLNEDDFTISRTQFPVLKRVEIQFQHSAVLQVWNCSALKTAFEGYDDLKFIFSVHTADGPMPPHGTVSIADFM